VTELLAALVQEGAIATAGARAEVSELTLPSTLRLTILRRLSFLPEDTLQALRAASILGSGFSLADLASVTGRPALDLSVVLAEAIRARIVEDDGAVLRFRQDLIRESIYADLPASVRRGLHREAGHRLAQTRAPALQVAEHLARGAARGDAAAIEWLTRAAREEAARSPDVASDLLARATSLMEPQDPGRDQLLAEHAGSLMLAGRIAEAEAACRSLLDRDHDQSVTGAVRICLGHALLAQGQAGDALRELERAGESPALTGTQQAAAHAWASYARLALGDLDGAAAAAEEARSAAVPAGDHLCTSIALATLALVAEFRGHLQDALKIIDEAVRLADRSPGRTGHRYPLHGIRGWLLIELDRPEEARSALGAGRQISEELGVRWPLPTYQVFQAFERFSAGEWDDARAELETGFELAEEIGEIYSRVYGYGVLSLISFHRNDISGAADAASAADRDLAGRSPGYRMTFAVWPRALIREAAGDLSRALATMAGAWDTCARRGLVLEFPAAGPDLVRLALAAGDTGRARDACAAVTEVAAANEVAWITGAALHCRGLLADDAEILQAAACTYARGSRPLQLALASEDAGAAFARQGDVERAPAPRSGALDLRAAARYPRPGPHRGCTARGGHPAWPPGPARPAAGRLAESHPGRARSRRAGRRGTVQSPDRRAPLRIAPDRADPRRARLRQAGSHLPGPSGCRGDPAARQRDSSRRGRRRLSSGQLPTSLASSSSQRSRRTTSRARPSSANTTGIRRAPL
jgi:tetratricopeptide (TPR) repeat protein